MTVVRVTGGYLEVAEVGRPDLPSRPEGGWRPPGRPDIGLPEGGGPEHPDHGFDPNYPDQSLPGEQPGVPPHLPDDQIVLAIHIPGRGWKHKMYPMPTWRPPEGGWQPPAGGIGGRPPERPGGGPGGPEVQPPRPGFPERPGQGLPPSRPPEGWQPPRPELPERPGQGLPPSLPQPPAGGVGGRPPERPQPPGGPDYPIAPGHPSHPDQSLPPGQPPQGGITPPMPGQHR